MTRTGAEPPSETRPPYRVRPLDPETWPDFARLVEANGGIWGGCWCLAFHAGDRSYRTPDARRGAKEALVRQGRAHAALVYEAADCIGWAQFGSADELPAIKNRKAYEATLDRLPDWRLTCFFVGKGHRGNGVAEARGDPARSTRSRGSAAASSRATPRTSPAARSRARSSGAGRWACSSGTASRRCARSESTSGWCAAPWPASEPLYRIGGICGPEPARCARAFLKMTSGRTSTAMTPKSQTTSVAITQVEKPVICSPSVSQVVTSSPTKVVTSAIPPVSARTYLNESLKISGARMNRAAVKMTMTQRKPVGVMTKPGSSHLATSEADGVGHQLDDCHGDQPNHGTPLAADPSRTRIRQATAAADKKEARR